jgi:hypothetical protein
MPRHARLAASIAVALTLASVDRGYGQSPWVDFAWKEAGLVVQMPATPTVNPKNAGRYSTVLEESTFTSSSNRSGTPSFWSWQRTIARRSRQCSTPAGTRWRRG